MDKTLLARGGLSMIRLQNFLAIAEAGSIAAAAGRHDTSKQSLFSRQLRELEEFFGTELTRRRGRGLELTDAGRRLATIVREQNHRLLDFVKEVRHEPKTLTVGSGSSTLEWLVIPALAGVRHELKEFRVVLHELRTDEAIGRLHDLSLDFAVVRTDAVRRPLKSASIGRVEYSLFVPMALKPERHQSPVQLLENLPIATALGTQFRLKLDEASEREDVAINFQLDCASFTQAAQAVRLGTHAAILPAFAARNLSADAERVHLPFLSNIERPLSLVWNERLHSTRPALKEFGRELHERLKQTSTSQRRSGLDAEHSKMARVVR